MSQRRSTLAATVALVFASPAAAQITNRQLADLLPPGPVLVEVLELSFPRRYIELSKRLQDAFQADPAWFQARVASNQPGQPLPYDPKLGLSEAEYREFVQLSGQLTAQPSMTATLHVEATPSGWRFNERTTLVALQNVTIDTAQGVVHTSFGTLSASSPVYPSASQRAAGQWTASRWQQEPTASNAFSATFAVGRFTADGRLVVYLQAREIQNGTLVRRADLLLRGRS